MSRLHSSSDKCLILIKALPHRSSKYDETVCCAGLGVDGKWRRQYPIPYRILDEPQKFGRWNWITYEFTNPRHDGRKESQKVVPESIGIERKLPRSQHAKCLAPAERNSFAEAESKGESLTIIRPQTLQMSWRKRAAKELNDLSEAHKKFSDQFSMFHRTPAPFQPCPYEFRFRWQEPDGKEHLHVCDDWETSTAFFRRREALGNENDALKSLQNTYENEYLKKGVVLGFSTHSRRQNQWLLVGVIRVDESDGPQLDL